MKPISKELFIDTIHFLQERDCSMAQVNKVFSNEFEDSVFYPYLKWETFICKILKELTNDKADWISYYCWELDFGSRYKPGSITDADGKNIVLKTAEDLWDLLISNEKDS